MFSLLLVGWENKGSKRESEELTSLFLDPSVVIELDFEKCSLLESEFMLLVFPGDLRSADRFLSFDEGNFLSVKQKSNSK